MRVLWFSTSSANYRFNDNANHYGYGGAGWMSSLQTMMNAEADIDLGVCFMQGGPCKKEVQENTTYYLVQHHKKSWKDKIIDVLKIHDVARDEVLWPYYISEFKKVIEDFKPDVIEVFGSELYIGLATIAAKELNVPCVLHIQGLLSLYIYIYMPPAVSKWSYYLADGLKSVYANWQYLAYWYRSCHREKAILKAVPHVIGRTHWDKAAMEVLNPQAQYHYGGEILRPCFYEGGERQLPAKPVIVTTSSGATYKGFDLVLKIANILKNEVGLDFEWKVFGNVNPSFAEKVTGIKHQDVNVSLCGVATAEQLRDAMLHATVYLQPSYVENSPNSVAEAQMLGLPAVATNVGGTASMVEDGVTGILFPCTDPYMGASALMRLICDVELNVSMGESGKQSASIRHNKEQIVKSLLQLYTEIASK